MARYFWKTERCASSMMTRSKCPRQAPLVARPRLVDQPHHRRVGRDEDPPLGVLLGHQVHRRGIRQVALEGIHRLVHQCHAVGEEQHALDPVAAHQQIASAMTVRVLPAPVAITTSALRSWSRSKASAMRRRPARLVVALDNLPG
jgi:hypothetical protein